MIIELKKFKKFYNENKITLSLKPKKYPIDNKKFSEYIDNCETKKDMELAQNLLEKTIHVTYRQFTNRLKEVGNDLKDFVKKEKFDKVILLLKDYPGENLKKSETWVTLLLYKTIKDIVDVIVTDFGSIPNVPDISKDDKILVVISDDASYSGSQVCLITADLKLAQKHGLMNITNFLAIPFISDKALKKIKKCIGKHIVISKNSQLIEAIGSKVPLYFDHKLADATSTFPKIYSSGLIKGCQIGDEKCPPAFYKRLKYFYEGKQIKDLSKLSTMSRSLKSKRRKSRLKSSYRKTNSKSRQNNKKIFVYNSI